MVFKRWSHVGGKLVGVKPEGVLDEIDTWTLVGDNLYLGGQPLEGLPAHVDVIVNVDNVRQYHIPEDVLYVQYSFDDIDMLPEMRKLWRIAELINNLRSGGSTVYVHCRLGLNRSALLAALCLLDGGQVNVVEWLRQVRDSYVLSNETFEQYVRAFARAMVEEGMRQNA